MTFSKDKIIVMEKKVARGWRYGENVTTKGWHHGVLWG